MKLWSKFRFYVWLALGAGAWFAGTFVVACFIDDHLGLYSSWWNPFFCGLFTLPVPLMLAFAIQEILAVFRRRRHVRDYLRLVECHDQSNADPEEVRRLFARLNKDWTEH